MSSAVSTLTIGLVQITEPMYHMLYLPYGVALLQTFAQAHAAEPGRLNFLSPLFLRQPIAQVVPGLAKVDILGCSIHIWNYQYTLALAEAVRAVNPGVLMVFGGPQVPDKPERFLREHPFINVCVHGEGEEVFLKLLESPRGEWDGIPGISWIDAEGSFRTNGKAPRVTGLDAIPSPYLNGYFDALMREHPTQQWVGVWESNRGCPFSCTFCDWGTINSKVLRFSPERVQAEIDWFGSHGIEIVYCTDANFGILPRDLEFARLLIRTKVRYGYPHSVLLQMTKNQADRSFQAFKELTDAGLLPRVPLSLQSVTPEVLTAIKRDNISLDVYHDLLKRFVNAGIATYTDHLIGLPGESLDSFLESIDAIISHGQYEELRFWNTYILPNAELADPDYRRKHGIES
ncbi:MAG TPA: radical SAM protein, partial [Candidatus Obscuribacterales bacterium]